MISNESEGPSQLHDHNPSLMCGVTLNRAKQSYEHLKHDRYHYIWALEAQ